MTPKFSICIFTYNRAEYIGASIKSALNQVYQNYEIIIVDDGSDDHTEAVVKSYESSKIKYIKKEHSGAPKTRNRAIAEAKGEYLVWLADDDMLLPAALQYYAIFLNQNPRIDVLYSHIRMFEAESDETTMIKANDWYNKNEDALAFLLKGSPVTDGGCAVRKKIYEEIGNYNEEFSRAQDYEFWTRLVQTQKYILKLVPKYLYLYQIHKSNITGKFNDNTDFRFEVKILEQLIKNNSLEKLFPNLEWNNDRDEAEYQAYYFLAVKHFYIKSSSVGIYYLEKALAKRALNKYEIKKVEEIIERLSQVEKEKIIDVLTQTPDKKIFSKYKTAMLEIDNSNYGKAEQELESILDIISTSKNINYGLELSDIQLLLANIYLVNNNYEKATTLFENVLEDDPSSSEACQGLGELLLINNNIESAKTMFEWAIKNNNQNEVASERLKNINKMLSLPVEHNSILINEEA